MNSITSPNSSFVIIISKGNKGVESEILGISTSIEVLINSF